MSKYRCRGCRIQAHCIDQSDVPPGIKKMLRSAFAARTDTKSTWAVLQKTCLLAQDDAEIEQRAKQGSVLSRRLGQVRAAKEEQKKEEKNSIEEDIQPADQAPPGSPVTTPLSEPTSPVTTPLSEPTSPVTTPLSEPTSPVTTPLSEPTPMVTTDLSDFSPAPPTVPAPVEALVTKALTLGTRLLETAPLDQPPPPRHSASCWLVVDSSQRYVSLPITGELILGRFDPYVETPLDVDLTYEDQNTLSVSRRHVKIVAADGHHTIEDLGSSNGLFVNETRVHVQPLQPGDRIALGNLQMRYDTIPDDFLNALATQAARLSHFLFLTHNGRKIPIAPPNDITIGRFTTIDIASNIDLNQDGEVSTYVSRSHAVISWRSYTPYFKDLNSTFGTRLNGEALFPHQAVPLDPGDHISLGGCVLAYDVEL